MTSPLIIRIDNQGGACPYQAEGVVVVNGVEYTFYFRYRSDHAQFYVWEPGYAHEYFDDEHTLFYRQHYPIKKIPHCGYMDDAEASGFINCWAEEFVRGLVDKTSQDEPIESNQN